MWTSRKAHEDDPPQPPPTLASHNPESARTDWLLMLRNPARPTGFTSFGMLASHAPESPNLFRGEVEAVHRVRQQALDAHYEKHRERYVQGPPKAARPAAEVWINPDRTLPADQLPQTPGALRSVPPEVETELPEVVM